jgi:hypothetical protein
MSITTTIINNMLTGGSELGNYIFFKILWQYLEQYLVLFLFFYSENFK